MLFMCFRSLFCSMFVFAVALLTFIFSSSCLFVIICLPVCAGNSTPVSQAADDTKMGSRVIWWSAFYITTTLPFSFDGQLMVHACNPRSNQRDWVCCQLTAYINRQPLPHFHARYRPHPYSQGSTLSPPTWLQERRVTGSLMTEYRQSGNVVQMMLPFWSTLQVESIPIPDTFGIFPRRRCRHLDCCSLLFLLSPSPSSLSAL